MIVVVVVVVVLFRHIVDLYFFGVGYLSVVTFLC